MNEHEIDRIASAFHVLRPDWPHASLRTFIANNLANRPRRDVAIALAWVACESNTATPARVLENGPWWKATNTETTATTTVHTGKTVGPRHGDPREICGICDMWRVDCDSRRTTSGHEFVARIECPVVEPIPPIAHLRTLRNHTAAELCNHGVPTANCLAHRDTTNPTPEETP